MFIGGFFFGLIIGFILCYLIMQKCLTYTLQHPEIIDSIIDRQLEILNKQVEKSVETKQNIFER